MWVVLCNETEEKRTEVELITLVLFSFLSAWRTANRKALSSDVSNNDDYDQYVSHLWPPPTLMRGWNRISSFIFLMNRNQSFSFSWTILLDRHVTLFSERAARRDDRIAWNITTNRVNVIASMDWLSIPLISIENKHWKIIFELIYASQFSFDEPIS